MIETQRVATIVISEVLAGASLTNVLQKYWHAHSSLSDQQRGAIQDISYGVLRFYGRINTVLGLLLKKPLWDQKLHCLLLVGLYQLQFSRTSAHAVVNHAVSTSLSLSCDKGAKGLINAVLRNFIRQREDLLKTTAKNEVGKYSHPQWWIDKLRGQYPSDYKIMLKINNQHPPMTLRVNQRKIKVAEYQAQLNISNITTELLWGGALKLTQPVAIEKLPGFHKGLVSIQDAGAQLAAPLLDAHSGMRVLDACAAPGGKSSHLLELTEIELTVLDHSPERLIKVKQNLTRLGLKKCHIICGNAANPIEWWDGKLFDRILADVPCSASGVVRHHPDIKWLRRESDLSQFTTTQKMILNSLWQTLARDGKLLYVTCSVFIEENRSQIEEFLYHHSDARTLSLSCGKTSNGQLFPNSQHDGFFYALLHKI
ncbi:MAG: 16S rRNA (cytosine(967)-C(5))-methyltransferase RsmB [Nitrosospira sp.]|nr:16S rRNA (cytosine(967)-C(5))-methyltransferase RsmB [Nitrosospira sp.]MBI0417105.1 16S rRNA (cytosine(967)-C(5))-methyltransferase RsmB [Nitrosospira sp.]